MYLFSENVKANLSPVDSPFNASSRRFVCKNNGVLFENQLLQIGIKSEYRQNLGEHKLRPLHPPPLPRSPGRVLAAHRGSLSILTS